MCLWCEFSGDAIFVIVVVIVGTTITIAFAFLPFFGISHWSAVRYYLQDLRRYLIINQNINIGQPIKLAY